MKEQRTVLYEGDVQGVGFRYTACRIAGGFDVAGYVCNLSDGRVEVVVEGEQQEIGGFLNKLQSTFAGYIRSQSQRTGPFSGAFETFDVRR